MEIGKRTLVALPVKDENLDEVLNQAKLKEIDIIELRVDQFSNFDIQYIREKAKLIKDKGFNLLLTVRSKAEGGGRDLSDDERLEIFRQTIDVSDIVDIEFSSVSIRQEVIKLTKDRKKLCLVSYHDFEKTPPADFIQEYINSAVNIGADIVKFAFKANSLQDIANTLCVTNKNRDKNLVAILMGDVGKISRVAGFVFGSVITYTYIGEAFAPGQIEAGKLIDELKFYGLR